MSLVNVDRIETAVRAEQDLTAVFPRLSTVGTSMSGEGTTVTVHFSKKEGAPVRFVDGDDPTGAAAVREVDLRKKFHLRSAELARVVSLTGPKAKALRAHLRIDEDPACCHVFEFGKTAIPCFSDDARNKMLTALEDGLDLDEVWTLYRSRSPAPRS